MFENHFSCKTIYKSASGCVAMAVKVARFFILTPGMVVTESLTDIKLKNVTRMLGNDHLTLSEILIEINQIGMK